MGKAKKGSTVHRLRVFSDEQHGWIRVKRDLLNRYSVASDITKFSYERGEWVYLEEDQDATTFFNAVNKAGDRIEQSVTHSRLSSIRNYDRYTIR